MANPSEPTAKFLLSPQPWAKEAACAGQPIAVWFDDCEQRDKLARAEAIKKAKAICLACPVRKQCGEQAMKEEGSAPNGRYGYRAGLSPSQRRALYRRGGLRGRDPLGFSVRSDTVNMKDQ